MRRKLIVALLGLALPAIVFFAGCPGGENAPKINGPEPANAPKPLDTGKVKPGPSGV